MLILGVLTFEAVGSRTVLLFFPNVFEFWFVFVAAARHYTPTYDLTWPRSLAWLVPITALKEFQEYALHGAQVARQLPRHRRSGRMVGVACRPQVAGQVGSRPYYDTWPESIRAGSDRSC